ncbi:MAG: ABC transporter ATP-binding protein [Candidatus Hodarchaeota archaeon]
MSSSSEILFKIEGLKKWFPVRTSLRAILTGTTTECADDVENDPQPFLASFRKPIYCHAVDGISFEIKKKEVVCMVGESGSGKTTFARVLLRLEESTEGAIYYKGTDITNINRRKFREVRRHVQMIFQNPYESLDPKKTVMHIVSEPLFVNNICSRSEVPERVFTTLKEVGLVPPEEFLERYPHELSGGQRQRVSIARSLILNPEFIVADEPASMLDANTRIGILNLLLDLHTHHNMSLLFITHDLAQARYLGDKLVILYLGKIVEMGSMEKIIKIPHHPYTRALISNIPVPDPDAQRERVEIKGEIPSAINLPRGCRFAPRCPYVLAKCDEEEPELMMKQGRLSACWLD